MMPYDVWFDSEYTVWYCMMYGSIQSALYDAVSFIVRFIQRTLYDAV